MEYIITYFTSFVDMFVHMSFYVMIGLLCVGLLNTYIKRQTVMKFLGKKNFASVVKASVIGVPLPLCSCGVVPTAIELKKDGASNGAVSSFLISTPQTGIDSIFATYSMMGLLMAIFRPVVAFISGIFGGIMANIFTKEKDSKDIEPVSSCCCSGENKAEEPKSTCCCSSEKKAEEPKSSCCCSSEKKEEEPKSSCCCSSSAQTSSSKSGIVRAISYGFGHFLGEIAVHFIVGIAIAALISAFLPEDLFVNWGLNEGILSMIAMIIIGLPMYVCSTSSIPIAMSLIAKGLSFGSAFVFIFVGPVTNIASILVLNKSLGKKFTAIYISSVIVCAIAFGYLLNFIINVFGLTIESMGSVGMDNEVFTIIKIVLAVVFAVLLIRSIIVKSYKKYQAKRVL